MATVSVEGRATLMSRARLDFQVSHKITGKKKLPVIRQYTPLAVADVNPRWLL